MTQRIKSIIDYFSDIYSPNTGSIENSNKEPVEPPRITSQTKNENEYIVINQTVYQLNDTIYLDRKDGVKLLKKIVTLNVKKNRLKIVNDSVKRQNKINKHNYQSWLQHLDSIN